MTELLVVCGFVVVAGALVRREWNLFRCSSSKAWFHDWVASGKKNTFDYKNGIYTYTATDESHQCKYCGEWAEFRIADSRPREQYFD